MVKKRGASEKLGGVSGYFDVVSNFIGDYFKQKYKLKEKVEDLKKNTIDAMYKLKRNVFKTLIECVFLITGLVALIIGVIMVLDNFIPIAIPSFPNA